MRIERRDGLVIVEVGSIEETRQLGAGLAAVVEPGTVVGLVGNLGAGKTLLVRAWAEALGVEPGAIASPTFVLIHEYQGRVPLYHFDTYRLSDSDEFDALGASEYWTEGAGICLIEWADRVADRLPDDTLWIRFELLDQTSRRIDLEWPGNTERLEQLANSLAGPV